MTVSVSLEQPTIKKVAFKNKNPERQLRDRFLKRDEIFTWKCEEPSTVITWNHGIKESIRNISSNDDGDIIAFMHGDQVTLVSMP